MKYKDKELKTFGDIFEYALAIAKKNDKDEAYKFVKSYVEYILEDAEDVKTYKEAMQRMISNFGYYAGYYGDDVRKLMNKYYGAVHPIFGNAYDVTPKEAHDCGIHNKKLERGFVW